MVTVCDAQAARGVSEAARLCRLEGLCLEDVAGLAGLAGRPLARRAIQLALGGRARRFARDLARFDRAVGRLGLARAARVLARRYGGTIESTGAASVPPTGPALLVANHPGLFDALAVYATAVRADDDLRALARPRPLLGLMPRVGRHLLMVPEAGVGRVGAARATLRHWDRGGAVLLFPAGHLEPEPALAGDTDPLGGWSPSLGMLVRLAARSGTPLRVVPAAVTGAIAETTWRRFRPLIRLRRTPRGRADLATLLQLAFPRLGPTTVRVRYGEPLLAATLAAAAPDAAALTERIRAELRMILAEEAGARAFLEGRLRRSQESAGAGYKG